MRFVGILSVVGAAALAVSGCLVIESLDQPYEAAAGKTFKTTIVARTPEAGEDEEETFVYSILGFSIPPGWAVEEIKTVGGDINPKWQLIPDGQVTTEVTYKGDGAYPWTFFRTKEEYSNFEHANKVFTVEVKIKPAAAGYYELGYVSGAAADPNESGAYSPNWGYNEVNGGQVVFKRIWVK